VIIHRRRGPAAADAAELQPGETLAGYRIEGLLGSGGMGAVYEATQLSLKRHVALKVIAPGVPMNDTLRGRFRREGELQAVIDHPHVLPVYEAGDDKGRLFIAMRLVPGPTLKKLAVARSLDPAAALHLLGDVASAIDAAHVAGLVHRDVKPQNILIAPGNHAYLADFGLSRGRSDNTLTRPGQLLGSLSYMAPEQARGEPAGAPADIYSFTCVLYECLVGLVPFPRETDHAVMHAHEWEDPPRPSEIRPELPPALDDVIARGMAKDPAARPATACAVVTAARAAFGIAEPAAADHTTVALPVTHEESEDTLRRPVAALPPTTSARGRSRVLAAAAAGALLLGGAGGYFATRDTAKPAARHVDTSRPDTSYGKRLNSAFTGLDGAQAELRTALGNARTPRAQAAVLAQIAAEYRHARAAVAAADPPASARSANARVEDALGTVATSYRNLATAARAGNASAYAQRRTQLNRAQSELTTALQGLTRAGFRLQ
jgi:serine/threonine-protein kinase